MKRHKVTRTGVDLICGSCGRAHSTVPKNNMPKKITCPKCKKDGPPKVQQKVTVKNEEPEMMTAATATEEQITQR